MIGHVHKRSRYSLPLLVVFLSLMSFGESRATTASKAEMDQVCQNWLSRVVFEQGSWGGSASPGVSAVHEIREGDVLLASGESDRARYGGVVHCLRRRA